MHGPAGDDRMATGLLRLDDILSGGLPRNRIHLVIGDPGVGKTTLALQFLLAGAARGEPVLYVTLSETAEELRGVAASHGWSLEGVSLFEMENAVLGALSSAQTLFHPSEVELNETTRGVLETVEQVRPQRVVFDSLSEMRLLARDPLRYRRQILALKQFFIGRGCTVLLLDDGSAAHGDLQLESLAHGVIEMEQLAPIYGAERRRLRVKKMRGMSFRGGYHDFRIVRGGVEVYPRLVAAEHHSTFPTEPLSSGLPALDALLGGGVDRGTSTLFVGPAGSGKSTLAVQFAIAAAARGERAILYLFEESIQNIRARSAGLKMPLDEHVATGRIVLRQVDPAELSPGELSNEVRHHLEAGDVRLIVLDTLNGYLGAMPEERFLLLHLHELLMFIGQSGAASIIIEAQHGPTITMGSDPLQVSFLADAVLLLRHFEDRGTLRQAISVVKKRTGRHERTIRELRVENGVQIGPPLEELHGILTGVPLHVRAGDASMETGDGTPPRS